MLVELMVLLVLLAIGGLTVFWLFGVDSISGDEPQKLHTITCYHPGRDSTVYRSYRVGLTEGGAITYTDAQGNEHAVTGDCHVD